MGESAESGAPYEIVTKLEVAERQLRVAVRLFFEDRDIVSVHTLASAAQEVLIGIGKRGDITSIFKDSPLIRPEKKEEMARLFNEAQNFFKHGSSDPGAQLKFYYGITPFYIFDAANLYIQITGKTLNEIAVFQVWFAARFPDLLSELGEQQIAEHARRIDPDDHRMFLEMIDHPPPTR